MTCKFTSKQDILYGSVQIFINVNFLDITYNLPSINSLWELLPIVSENVRRRGQYYGFSRFDGKKRKKKKKTHPHFRTLRNER